MLITVTVLCCERCYFEKDLLGLPIDGFTHDLAECAAVYMYVYMFYLFNIYLTTHTAGNAHGS